MPLICKKTKRKFDAEECKTCEWYTKNVACVKMVLSVPKKMAEAYSEAKEAGEEFKIGGRDEKTG